jgi:hypothetical protein
MICLKRLMTALCNALQLAGGNAKWLTGIGSGGGCALVKKLHAAKGSIQHSVGISPRLTNRSWGSHHTEGHAKRGRGLIHLGGCGWDGAGLLPAVVWCQCQCHSQPKRGQQRATR